MVCKEILSFFKRSAMVPMVAFVIGCSTLDVGSDFDRQANLAGYHTFMIMDRSHDGVPNPPGPFNPPALPFSPGEANPLVAQYVRDAIPQELARKGYRRVSDPLAADFLVDYTVGAKERLSVESYPGPYSGFGGPGWWGGAYWGGGIDVRQIREGTLSIDVFDTHTHRPVWHGWAKKDISREDMENAQQPIREAVAAILAKFPT